MFTSIVVGTDGSGSAREAVRTAAEMAKRDSAQLHVVSAYRVFGDMVLVAPALENTTVAATGEEQRIVGEVQVMLQRLASEIGAQGVTVTTHISSDHPAQAILDVAQRQQADLIVVGNRGTGSLRFAGSVPINVVHHAPCSVLVVHTWPPAAPVEPPA